jgi:hypothetical protein
MNPLRHLTPLADYLIEQFDKELKHTQEAKISVNPVVSEVAHFYEKLRNAMDYREDDVVLRAAIERILKRRLMLGGNGDTIAEPLVIELLWARYFPDASVPESINAKIASTINLYFKLESEIVKKHKVNRTKLSEFIIQLLSCEIEDILSPSKDKEWITNFMFQVYQNRIKITDDDDETRDAQVYIAVRRTYAKQDLPFLRYHLFKQLFGPLNESRIDEVSEDFLKGYKKIEYHLNYPLHEKIYTFVKKQTVPFFILEDILRAHRGNNRKLIQEIEHFKIEVFNTCARKYKTIASKVQTAIIRGVIFILVTKAIFALGVEGTFEKFVYNEVMWGSLAVNTLFPPILMIIAGFMITTPNRENTAKIFDRLENILFNNLQIPSANFSKNSKKIDPMMNLMFLGLWFIALLLVIGGIIYVLSSFGFNPISQGVFIFFVAIVSFISYRINQTAHMYTILDEKQNMKSVLFDFFFMPFIHFGRGLTENIARINLVLFFFDLIIETPFKVLFAFFEQWFLFLRTQREKLG